MGVNPIALLKGHPASNGFIVPSDGVIAEAFDTVLRYDKAFHKEMAVLVDAKGRKILEKLGAETEVAFQRGELEPGEGGALIHNHPVACSLSHQDLVTATGNGFGIWAVAGDGGRFFSNGYSGNPWRVMIEQEAMRSVLAPLLNPFLEKEVIDEDQAAMVYSHLANLIMVEKGLMEDYGFVLGQTTLEAMELVSKSFERAQPTLAERWNGLRQGSE